MKKNNKMESVEKIINVVKSITYTVVAMEIVYILGRFVKLLMEF